MTKVMIQIYTNYNAIFPNKSIWFIIKTLKIQLILSN